MAILLPFAPIVDQQTTVSWPQAGRAPESTTAFFVPYSPTGVHVEVPCTAVRAGQDRARLTTLVSSHLPGRDTTGFVITTSNEQLRVLLGGREVYRAPVGRDGCGLVLDSGQDGSTLRVGARSLRLPDDRVLQIQAFSTELQPAQASGLRVEARTADWFQSSPTVSKLVLIGCQLALAGGSLFLLALGDRKRRRLAERPDQASAPRLGWRSRFGDAGMLVTLGAWAVLGPRTADDSFTEAIVRNSLHSGTFTNYYRWENSAEAPFTLVLRLLQPLVAAEANPLVLRLPSMLAGLLVWLLLSRGALPVLLPEHARRFWVRAVLAAAVLAWWLPFNLGVRPEPFVALGVTAVFTCLLRGTARQDGAGLVLLGLAGLAAGLTIATSPSAVVVFAPILLLAPRIWHTVRGPSGAGGVTPIGWLALACCLGAVGLVTIFADQSAYGILRATELHQFYGPNVGWFQEVRRYEYLLGFSGSAGLGRRLPVLVTIAVLGCAVLLLVRGARRLLGMRLSYLPVTALALGFGLLWLTPSKWTHYFGSLAGLGAAALTTGVVLLAATARHQWQDRTVVLIGAAGTIATALAASLAFAGKNTWFLYSHWGVPHDETPYRPLNNPLLWLLLVAILLALTRLPRFAGTQSTRAALARMPAVIASVAIGLLVPILLVSFAVAPIRQAGSYSEGGQNVSHLTGGDTCGILDYVVTTRDVAGGELDAARGKAAREKARFTGFKYHGGYPSDSQPPDPPGVGGSRYLWGSMTDNDPSTGELTSQWLSLPRLTRGQELALSVAGRTGDGNRVSLEFARAAPGAPHLLGERVIDDTYRDADEREQYPADKVIPDLPQDRPGWRSPHMDAEDVPRGADLVRVRATDATVDAGGWVAVTGPRIRETRPVRDLLAGRDPVYVDLAMLWSAPCVRNLPVVAGGLAEAPQMLIKPPAETGLNGSAPFNAGAGGSFAGQAQTGGAEVVPTRLLGSEDRPQYADWGQAVLVTYPVQRDAYDVRTSGETRWGWEGSRTPVGTVPTLGP